MNLAIEDQNATTFQLCVCVCVCVRVCMCVFIDLKGYSF